MTSQIAIKHNIGDFNLDLSFKIGHHCVTALYGKSGCGKTTILRCLAGLTRADARVQWRGEIWQSGQSDFMPAYKRPVGLVFQDTRLLPHLSVEKNLQFAYKRRKGAPLLDTDAVIDNLGLSALLAHKPAHLSAGQKQRVAIARSILNAPQLLLMDEPLSNLDQYSKNIILSFIDTLQRQSDISIIYVSHDINEVCHLADEVILIDEGRLIAQDSLLSLCARLDLGLAHEENAGAIVEGQIGAYDPNYQITTVKLDEQHELQLSQEITRNPGDQSQQTLRLRIPARDISLSLTASSDSSILNILPATIDTIESTQSARVLVKLQIGKQHLLARITKKSVDQMKLHTGQTVYAQIKSVALLNERT